MAFCSATMQCHSDDLKAATRKADWYIMPLLFFCYCIQGMDKQVLSYAAVMGLPRDLALQGNDFSNAATSLSVATLVGQLPNMYALNKFPAGKWLAANCLGWGIATGCMAATHSYSSLLACRVFIGLFEAAVQPSVALIIGQDYRKDKSGMRYMFMGVSIGSSVTIGAILSYGFQNVRHSDLAGWRILCTLLGCVTTVFGVGLYILLPDTPMTAPFLREREKVALLNHLAASKTGVRSTTFSGRHALEVARDPQIWFFTLLTTIATMCTGFTLSYSPTVIASFGYSAPQASLLSVPGGVVSIVVNVIAGALLNTKFPPAAVAALLCVLTFVAGSLLTFSDDGDRAALLTGVYLVNCGPVFFVVAYHWASANVAGQTKRTAVMTLITAGFAAGA